MEMKLMIAVLIIVVLVAVLVTRYYRNKYKVLRSIMFKRRSQMPMVNIQCPKCANVFMGEQPGYFEKYVERKCSVCDFEWDEEVEGHCTVEDGMYSIESTRRKFENAM